MNVVLIVILIVALLAGTVLLFGFRRRARGEADRGPLTDEVDDAPEIADPAPAYAGPAPDAAPTQDPPPPPDESAQEIGADFYEEVVRLLEGELSHSPRRSDLRFKLLEMYAATHRKTEFLELARQHRSTEAGKEDPYWVRIAETGRQLLPEEALFALSAEEMAAAGGEAAREAPRKFRRYYDSVDAALLGALESELQAAFQDLRQAASFWKKLRTLHTEFIGARAPVVHVEKLSRFVGGAQIYVRHDPGRAASDAATLSAVGQVLLAQALGRRRVIAAPAGEGHALAVARAAQRLGLQAQLVVTEREQELRADELQALGAFELDLLVVPDAPPGTSMESQRAALALALQEGSDALYLSPIEAGPFPYPVIVQELQGLAGRDLKSQVSALAGRAPNGVIVSTADGMPAIGVLQAFLGSKEVKLYCVEAGGGIGHGPHRLGREHAWLRATGRVRYSSVPPEVARFAARHCMPDGIGDLHLAGGEVLVETFTLSRQFSPDEVVAVVIPAALATGEAG